MIFDHRPVLSVSEDQQTTEGNRSMIDEALSMEEPKMKLRDLAKYLPKMDESIYEFGVIIADYLNPELFPMGFVMGCELALNDLSVGVNGFTKKPFTSRLAGLPPQMYGLLRAFVPSIAAAVFPEEFAAEVKAFMGKVNASMVAKAET